MSARRDYSREDMSWANALANKGYDAHMIARTLAKKPSGKRGPYSLKYQRILDERGREAADAYAERTARKAVEFVRDNPPFGIGDPWGPRARLIEITRRADEVDWSGAPGARKALEAALHFALSLASPTVKLSLALRPWAEMAGQSKDALRNNVRRLVALGWVVKGGYDARRGANAYRLTVPDTRTPPGGTETDTRSSQERTSCVYPCAAYPRTPDPAHDVWRPGALGDSGWLRALDPSRLLYFWWLRALPAGGWAEIPRSAYDRSAEESGTLGEGARDRRIHQDERAAYSRRG